LLLRTGLYNQRHMENYADILTKSIGPNTIQSLLIAIITFIVVYIALTVFWKVLLKRLRIIAKKTKIKADDVVLDVLEGVGQLFYIAIALFVSVQSLALSPAIGTIIKAVFLIAVVSEVIKLADRVIHYSLVKGMQSKHKSMSADEEAKISGVFSIFIKFGLWSIGGLLILSNLGFNVTSLIAGLGIGGLAISLALQNVLGDMFSSLSIAVDKPFQEGDFIVVGDNKGTVKHVGIKTTRLEALEGEEIVISNTELTTARVQNYRKLKKRRVVFTVGVEYGTPTEKLKKIPGIIKQCIANAGKTEFDRCHFVEFGDSNLNYEIVYYIESKEYIDYVDAQQKMNISILDEFAKEGIEMAFPTQTIHVVK